MGRTGDVVSKNRYVYVKNNPLKYVDPTGEEEKSVNNWNNIGESTTFLTTGEKALLGSSAIYISSFKWLPTGLKAIGGKLLGGIGFAYDLFKPEGPVNAGEEELLRQCGNYCFNGPSVPKGSIIGGASAGQASNRGVTYEVHQKTTGDRFSDGKKVPDKIKNRLISEVSDDIKKGIITPEEMPTQYVNIDGKNIVLNNRGYEAITEAGKIPVFREVPYKGKVKRFTWRLLKASKGIFYKGITLIK